MSFDNPMFNVDLPANVYSEEPTLDITFGVDNPQCRCDKFMGSGVSHRVSQWILVVLICTKSYQLKTKSNPGKFLRKCSFSVF